MITKKKIDWRILAIAILCLTAIEIAAMFRGINGTLRTFIVSAICLMAGLSMPKIIKDK